MSLLYITSFFPSEEEPYRGHFVEKQASLLSEKLNEKLIVFKPLFSGKSLKKGIEYQKYNGIEIYNFYFPNPLKQMSLFLVTRIFFSIYSKKINNILNKNKPKLIISNNYLSAIKLANLIKNNYKTHHYTVIHGEDTAYFLQKNFLNNFILNELNKCDQIICVSEKMKKYIRNKFKFKKDNLRIISNGLEKSKIDKYKNYNFNKNNLLTITSIGNLNYNKGFDILIKALKDLDINFKCNIIGEGNYKDKLIQMTNQYNLSDKINFVGSISNERVFDFLERSHFFILPSRNEAFGIVYLEAMITKNIVIAQNGQGCGDFIDDTANGFLVDNYTEIKEILEKYILENLKYNEISEEAFKTAQKYTWEANTEKIKLLLIRMIYI